MNTPPKKRRHKWDWDPSNLAGRDGTYAVGLSNPQYAELFTGIVTEFNHLETQMQKILAVLLGVTDERAAGLCLSRDQGRERPV
jgi:hypothetical protein